MSGRPAPVLAGTVVAAAAIACPDARAARLAPPTVATVRLRTGISGQLGLTPPFFDRPRDRVTAELGVTWQPDPRVALDAAIDALRWDLHGQGERHTGGGDIRLGTDVQIWPGAVAGGLRWQVKLPDAEDEPELGTDETDVALLAVLRSVRGPAALRAAGGVDLRGDPNALRSRDAVPLFELSANTSLGLAEGWLSIHGELPTQREPGRALVTAGAERGCPVSAGAALLWGPTDAGPDVGARLFVGWRSDCAGDGPTDAPALARR